MAIPARILIQILLMIFFRREEILERRHFYSEPGAVFCFLVLIHGLNLGHSYVPSAFQLCDSDGTNAMMGSVCFWVL
jgi:hypothetical protein